MKFQMLRTDNVALNASYYAFTCKWVDGKKYFKKIRDLKCKTKRKYVLTTIKQAIN